MKSPIKYARNRAVHLAYRIFGDAPRDIVVVPGTISHVELFWQHPVNAYLLRRLSSFARVIVFDKRGQGLSDRVASQTIEERVDDLRAVMDAAGSDCATIYGWSEGGQMSLSFASRHPERTSALALYGSYASMRTAPWSISRESFERILTTLAKHWGEGILVKANAPSRIDDEAFVQWFGRLEREVASPGSILALFRANYELDVEGLLGSIRTPTLIAHREGDALVPVAAGRYLASHIAGARYLELPGTDHLLQALDVEVLDALIDAIEELVTGSRQSRDARELLAEMAISDSREPRESDYSRSAEHPQAHVTDAISDLQRCRDAVAAGADAAHVEGLLARVQGLVAAATGSWQESESQFAQAILQFRRHKMAWEEARTLEAWEASLAEGSDRNRLIEKLDSTIAALRKRSAVRPAGDNPHEVARGALESTARGTGNEDRKVSAPNMFRREGDYWTVSWNGNLIHLKDAKGFLYLSYLIANSGRQVTACELAAIGTAAREVRSATGAGLVASNLGDAGAILDLKARKSYQSRIAELRAELAEADRCNDSDRASRLRWELETLGDQIAAAVGLRGRSRSSASHRERARLMVTKAIKAAIAKIDRSNPPLGHHLATCVKTGNLCAYNPGPIRIAWSL